MSKPVKELYKVQCETKFADVNDFVVVATKGMDGNDNNTLRGVLKDKGIRLTVVKNSIMRNAMDSLGKAAAINLFMSGPCTVAYGGDSVVDVAKEIEGLLKKYKAMEIKGAFVDGEALGADGAKELAKMPTRAELQGQIVVLANSPGRKVAAAIASPAGNIAGCIKSLIEKLEEAA